MSTVGFSLNTQLTASINTNIYSQQITPSKYHHIIKIPIPQSTLFSAATYQDNTDAVSVTLTVNSNVSTGLRNNLATSATAQHNTAALDLNQVNEWVNLDGTSLNSALATANANYVKGYYSNTTSQFSAALISSARTVGACVLDIIAKATFNHPGAKAAIANDASFQDLSITDTTTTTALAASLTSQLTTIFANEAQSIFDQYVADYPDRYATDQTGSDFNDVTSSKTFNFVGTTFYAYLALTSNSVAVMTNDTSGTYSGESNVLPLSAEVPTTFARIIRLDFEVSA